MRLSRLPHAQHGAVLADLKATSSGWPPASLDPGCGRHPKGNEREPRQRGIHNRLRILLRDRVSGLERHL